MNKDRTIIIILKYKLIAIIVFKDISWFNKMITKLFAFKNINAKSKQ
jgi:hypothetical protein